jgi:putative flippase GtrA
LSGERPGNQQATEARESARPGEVKVALINFGEAQNAVFFCPLWEWNDLSETCPQRLNSISSGPDQISTVYIGASYGQEDRFRTPLGEQYGVELHAYSAYSLLHPVKSEEAFKLLAFFLALGLGLISAFVFDRLWKYAAHFEKYTLWRFLSTLAVFAVLSLLAVAAVVIMPVMLNHGTWMNPLVILAGFFIDSYQASLEKLAENGSDERAAHTYPACRPNTWCAEFFGACADGKALITCAGLKALDCDTLFQAFRSFIVYWSIVGYVLYLMFAK